MNKFSRVKWASSWKSKTEEDMLELKLHVSRCKDLRLEAMGACLQNIHKPIQEMKGDVTRGKETSQTMKPPHNVETKVTVTANLAPLRPGIARLEKTVIIPYPFSASDKGSNAKQQTSLHPGAPLGAVNQEPRLANAYIPTAHQFRPPCLRSWPSPSAVSPGFRPKPNIPTAQEDPRKFAVPSRTQQKQNSVLPTCNPLPITGCPSPITPSVPNQNYKPIPTSPGHADITYGASSNGTDLQRYLKLPKKSCNRMTFDPFGNETPESKQRRADLAACEKPDSTPLALRRELGQQASHPLQTASTPVPKKPLENRRAGPKYPIAPPSVYTEADIVPPAKGFAPYPSDTVQHEKKPSKSQEHTFAFNRNNIYGQSVPITIQGSTTDFRARLGLPTNLRLPLHTLVSSMDIFIS
ncbi:hypothetical protein CaCOL14_005490 [Colletotrichum acutatum]